jgi:hypothetical protein
MLDDSDLKFLAKFEAADFTAAEFGHREHLQIAYIYLAQSSFEIALVRIEFGLRGLLAHLGAPQSKYHQTLTRAWLLAVQHFMRSKGQSASFAEFIQHATPLLDQSVMETHYTPERLWSDDARTRFLAPDLEGIPTHAD